MSLLCRSHLRYVHWWKNAPRIKWSISSIENHYTKFIVWKRHLRNLERYLQWWVSFRNGHTLDCIRRVYLVSPLEIHFKINIIWSNPALEQLNDVWDTSDRTPGHYWSWSWINIDLLHCRCDIIIITKFFWKRVSLARRWIINRLALRKSEQCYCRYDK